MLLHVAQAEGKGATARMRTSSTTTTTTTMPATAAPTASQEEEEDGEVTDYAGSNEVLEDLGK